MIFDGQFFEDGAGQPWVLCWAHLEDLDDKVLGLMKVPLERLGPRTWEQLRLIWEDP